jgi:6-phosphogluconolactonase
MAIMMQLFFVSTKARCGWWGWLLAMAGVLGGCAVAPMGQSRPEWVYVGMDGGKLHALRFDANTGNLAMVGAVADVPKPRWAVAHPQLPGLYVAGDGNGSEGSVIAFSLDRETGSLAKMNEMPAGGGGTTHLWLDAPSMTLVASNFGGGSVSSFSINDDGALGARVSTVKATGSGPHRRQASSHAHGSVIDPSGRFALVSDMGADRVFVYAFDRTSHRMASDDKALARALAVPPGSGPRRAVFGADGRYVYVLSELTADIMVMRWDAQQGRLSQVQTLSMVSPGFQGAKSSSEIVVSADGRFVYVGNRGENALLVYQVDDVTGTLSLLQRVPSGGELPWHFAIHAGGKWMLVANQRSNRVNLFSIDPASGMLTDTGLFADSPAPVSVTFVN